MTLKEQAAAAVRWWRELQPGDRAALARLRRAATPLEAAMEPAALDLCRRLGAPLPRLDRVAVVAALLAEVRGDTANRVSLARQAGAPPGADRKPLVSELRFRRAIATEKPEEMLTAFRRLITQAGRSLDVRDLAESLFDWSDARRRRWLYDYYHTDVAVPAATPDTSIK